MGRSTARRTYQRPAKQEGTIASCTAASSTGVPQPVLWEGKGCACVSKEHGLPGAALQRRCVFQCFPQRAVSKAKCKPHLLPGCFRNTSEWKKPFTVEQSLPQYLSIHTYKANLAHISLLDAYRPSRPCQEHSKCTCSEHQLLLRHRQGDRTQFPSAYRN